jgi:hypothetical protein
MNKEINLGEKEEKNVCLYWIRVMDELKSKFNFNSIEKNPIELLNRNRESSKR